MASVDRLIAFGSRATRQAPLLPVAAAFAVGVALALAVRQPLIAVGVFSLAAASLVLFRRSVAAMVMAVAALGGIDTWLHLPEPAIVNDFSSVRLFYKADILSVSESDYARTAKVRLLEWSADSAAWHKSPPLEALISVPHFQTPLSPGKETWFTTQFKPVEETHDLPDETNPSVDHLNPRIRLRAMIPPADIRTGADSEGWRPWLRRVRHDLSCRILSASDLNPGAKEFMTTALLGDASELSADTRDVFSAAGLSHILALSGLHVDIIAAIIALALWPLRIFRRNVAGFILTMLLLWFYAALTGFSASVTRAVVMASLFLTGRILQRRSTPLNSLCAAALVILIVDPPELLAPGFQLSFAAVASILIFADRLNPAPRSQRIPYALMSLLAVSLSAVMGTALISIFHFHSFPVYFIPANLTVLLIVPWLLGASALWLILSLCGVGAAWLGEFINTLHGMVEAVARWIASLPGAMIGDVTVDWPAAALYILTLGILWLWLSMRRRALGVAFALCMATGVATFALQTPRAREARLYVTRQTYRTDIVVDGTRGSLHIITTAPAESAMVENRAIRHYGRYMLNRGIDSLRVMGIDKASGPGYTAQNGVLRWGKATLAIANGAFDFAGNADYVIVCRGYRGKIMDLLDSLKADTVILSRDLHPRRRTNYLDECSRNAIPVIDMAHTGWSLPYRASSWR